MIGAITFDFWNTLFVAVNANALRRRRIKGMLKRSGWPNVTEAQIQHAIHKAWREWDRVWVEELRTFGAEHWVRLVLDNLQVSLAGPEREQLVRAMEMSGMEVSPPLVDGADIVLPRLAQSYRLGLICDTGLSPGWMLRQWMESHGILGYFTHLTFSDELGVSKPHPEAFLTTLARLRVPPDAAVHIGDYPRTDIAGARSVGMRTIRFTGVYDWDDGLGRADSEVASFTELESLLNQWEC